MSIRDITNEIPVRPKELCNASNVSDGLREKPSRTFLQSEIAVTDENRFRTNLDGKPFSHKILSSNYKKCILGICHKKAKKVVALKASKK